MARTALHLANERLADRLVAQLEIDQLVASNLLEGLDELTAVDHHGHRVYVVAVYHPGKATLTAQRLEVPAAIGPGVQLERNGGGGRQCISPSG